MDITLFLGIAVFLIGRSLEIEALKPYSLLDSLCATATQTLLGVDRKWAYWNWTINNCWKPTAGITLDIDPRLYYAGWVCGVCPPICCLSAHSASRRSALALL